MKFTKEELQTIKDCADVTLTQLGEISNLRKKIIKLLDKIEPLLEDDYCETQNLNKK
jgi:hypothetical protein